jgi:ABC-2 type transport system permease protein
MLAGGVSSFGLATDFAVQLVVTAVLVAIAARLYPRMAT